MAQLISVRLVKSDHQPLGFRLQGGKDFGTPLVIQKVNGGSAAESAGLQAGDAVIRVNTTDVYNLRHQEAQDAIRASGQSLELTVQRGGGTWRPAVTPTGSLPRPGKVLGAVSPVTKTSLKASPQPSLAFGSGHNNVAKPFNYMNGTCGDSTVKSIVNKQYNTPVSMYSDQTIAETLSAQTEVLAGGVLGVNFKKNEKSYDAEKSAVFKMLQEDGNDPEPDVTQSPISPPISGLRHVAAPVARPDAPVNNTGGLPPGQNICEECERLIIGVFVRIKDKNLHVECFKCATCGTSLKNQGYYNLNGKLYCDIHAKLVARQHTPAPNLEPVTVPPGGKIPSGTYSAPLSAHTTPLPPLATGGTYSNGSSSLFSPNSNLSGPKPFGSTGSAYSPSLSPRSAPLSPAAPRPLPTHQPPAHAPPPLPVHTHAPAPKIPVSIFKAKSVKNVVWPPINQVENEPLVQVDTTRIKPNIQAENTYRTEPAPLMVAPWMENANAAVPQCQRSHIQNKSIEQITAEVSSVSKLCHETKEVNSATVFSSASVESSNLIQTVTKQSEMSQMHEAELISSSSVATASEQLSTTSLSQTMYQSQTSPPIQTSFINPVENPMFEHLPKNFVDNEESDIKIAMKHKQSICSSEVVNIIDTISQKNSVEPILDIPVYRPLSPTPEDQVKADKIDEDTNRGITEKETSQTIVQKNEELKISQDEQLNLTTERCQATVSALSNVQNSPPRGYVTSLAEAVTIAPERSYSPLPQPPPFNPLPTASIQLESVASVETESKNINTNGDNTIKEVNSKPSPMFIQTKRGITPIPPIKAYNPPEKKQEFVPMPPETTPYIPPDFKINIEPREPREGANSPLVTALTTASDRPFTPLGIQIIERGSMRDALTIAPERAYSPLPHQTHVKLQQLDSEINNQKQESINQKISSDTMTSSAIIRPIATQTTTNVCQQTKSIESLASMQNAYRLQSSSENSAFIPVGKQTFPSPLPEQFNQVSSLPRVSNQLKSNYERSSQSQSKTDSTISEGTHQSIQQSNFSSSCQTTIAQSFSSTQTSSQSYFEQLDKSENLSSTAVRAKSGLQKPDNIPLYQKKIEQLPSQRGITPEVSNAPAVLQKPVTPTTDAPSKNRKEKPIESIPIMQPTALPSMPLLQLNPSQEQARFHHDTPISMTFQPVSVDSFLRASPVRSRPSTPSLINKPAPVIPHYQMNLVAVEHLAPDSHIHEPSSPETSRSPTPKLRSRSPAAGPPPNPLKAHAPRIKESTPQRQTTNSLLTQATSNLRKEHEMAHKGFQSTVEIFNSSGAKNWAQNQPSVIKEQQHSKIGFHSQSYTDDNLNIQEDSIISQNYAQQQMHSHQVSEIGNTVVQSTKKTFEEFERTQSAKVIEIRNGGQFSQNSVPANDFRNQTHVVPPKQTFPPPVMNVNPSQQPFSHSIHDNVAACSQNLKSFQPNQQTCSANKDPVCDPTPSTGSSLGSGGAARGKTFGVSSAPKRGRGVLNKAATPGSRVPLCAQCNGHIRGPFITALGRIWCPDHFICVNASCRRPLQDIGFVEENGQLYCEYCFEQFIAPACDKCHAKIKGDCLNAIGKHFHPECFNCVYCGKLFGNNPFFLEDGLPYCEADWNELFTTKCFACGFPVEAGDRWVEALNNNYHSQCFNCTMCKKNLEGQSFFAKGGRPFCKNHAR